MIAGTPACLALRLLPYATRLRQRLALLVLTAQWNAQLHRPLPRPQRVTRAIAPRSYRKATQIGRAAGRERVLRAGAGMRWTNEVTPACRALRRLPYATRLRQR